VSGPLQRVAPAVLENVAIGHGDGYDRVVFQFRNHLPGYRVEYVQPPFREAGSGNPLEVAGRAFVDVRMATASGSDLVAGAGKPVYRGPRRIRGSQVGAEVVRELVRTGDFEAVLSWAVGLEDRVGFRVSTMAAPPRLVVDFTSD
jgi:hypothetical protein